MHCTNPADDEENLRYLFGEKVLDTNMIKRQLWTTTTNNNDCYIYDDHSGFEYSYEEIPGR